MSKSKNITRVPQYYEPYDYQLDMLKALDQGLNGDPNGARKAFLVWPRQVGKDTTCWAYMCKQACTVPGNYFYIFPTQTQAKKALWTKVTRPEDGSRRIIDFIPKELVERKLEQEMFIQLTNGSTIKVEGLENDPEKIRGITPTGVVFSEFAFSHPDGYKNIKAAIRGKSAWIIMNSTPNGRNHFYEMYQGVKESPEWYVSHLQALWPEKENFIYVKSPQEYEMEVAEGTPWDEIEREYGCSFAAGIKGSYYSDCLDEAREQNRIGTYVYDENKLVDTFWDIGASDDAPVWFRQVDNNKIIFIDYCEDAGKGVRDYISMLAEKGYRYRTHFLPHDAANKGKGQDGESTMELFENMLDTFEVSGSVEVLTKNPSKQNGINAVRARFGRYHFDEHNCHFGLRHIEGYSRAWDRHNSCFRKDPKHDEHSHAADALRYEAESGDDGPRSWRTAPQIKINSGLDIGDI